MVSAGQSAGLDERAHRRGSERLGDGQVEGGAKGEKQFAISITGSTYPEPARLTVPPVRLHHHDSASRCALFPIIIDLRSLPVAHMRSIHSPILPEIVKAIGHQSLGFRVWNLDPGC